MTGALREKPHVALGLGAVSQPSLSGLQSTPTVTTLDKPLRQCQARNCEPAAP